MVKCATAFIVALLFAVPALAQDDFPQFEIAMGYGNIGLGENLPLLLQLVGVPPGSERSSGFAMHTGFNFTHWLGLDNYTGYYTIGDNSTLFLNVFGGKLSARNLGRVVPYGVAGLGGGSMTIANQIQDGGFATRLGGGVDIGLNDSLTFKLDVSRISTKAFDFTFSGINFSTGIGFNLGGN